MRANRITLFAVGLVALAVSYAVDSVVGAVTVAADLLAAALLVPVVGAMFWRRSTAVAAIGGVLAGSTVCVAFMAISGLYANEPVMYGMAAALAVFVTLTLATRPDPAVAGLAFEELPDSAGVRDAAGVPAAQAVPSAPSA
ncbi:hypothetical protein ACFQ2Y_48115 [Streptomyces malaysiensis subsp. malaysiensis]